jgi:hypothetical protein
MPLMLRKCVYKLSLAIFILLVLIKIVAKISPILNLSPRDLVLTTWKDSTRLLTMGTVRGFEILNNGFVTLYVNFYSTSNTTVPL